MIFKAKYLRTTCILAASLTVIPAFAQLGLGSATGSVGGTVQGTAGAVVSQPGAMANATAGSGLSGATSLGAGHALTSSTALAENTALSSRLSALLPPTASLPAAASGFQNDSDFFTTLHAAHNLNIPFEQLKAETTGKHATSLNAAIRKARPDLDGRSLKDSLSLAQHQSQRDVEQAGTAGSRNRIATRVVSDDRLAARLNPIVPQGQTLSEAASGFKSEEQFASTLHAASDNGIAFTELKDRVTAGQSLAAAIHDLKPDMDMNASAAAAASADTKSKNDKAHGKADVSASASANASASVNAR